MNARQGAQGQQPRCPPVNKVLPHPIMRKDVAASSLRLTLPHSLPLSRSSLSPSTALSCSLPSPSASSWAKKMKSEFTHDNAYSWRKSPLTSPAALTRVPAHQCGPGCPVSSGHHPSPSSSSPSLPPLPFITAVDWFWNSKS